MQSESKQVKKTLWWNLNCTGKECPFIWADRVKSLIVDRTRHLPLWKRCANHKTTGRNTWTQDQIKLNKQSTTTNKSTASQNLTKHPSGDSDSWSGCQYSWRKHKDKTKIGNLCKLNLFLFSTCLSFHCVTCEWCDVDRSTTLAKKIVTAEIFMRLIRSAIVWYHATSTSARSSRRVESQVASMSNRSLISHDFTWSDCRINLMNFSAVAIFLARVVYVKRY